MLDRAGVRRHVGERRLCRGHARPDRRAPASAEPRARAGGGASRGSAGVIHEASPVVGIEDVAGRPVVRTAGGAVRPEALILAGNAYLGRGGAGDRRPGDAVLDADHGDRAARRARAGAAADRRLRRGRALRARLLPAVGGRAAALGRRNGLRRHRPGGHPGEAGAEPRAGISRARGACASTTPGRGTARSRSAGCRSWGGSGRTTYFAQGYSGHGVVGSHLFGRILAEAVHGDRSRFDVFASGAVDSVPRAGGASRFPIPSSARGGMACGIASACETESGTWLDEDHAAADGPREPARRSCARAGQQDRPRLQLVGLYRRGHGREVRGGDRDQGRLRRLRLERGAGGEAPRRQLRLRRGGADLEASCSGRSRPGSTSRSTSRSCRT